MASIANLQPIPISNGIPPHPDSNASYKGPSMGWLLKNHKLAHQVIACHTDPAQQILDHENLALLKLYVEEPSQYKALLEKFDRLDAEGEEAGERAVSKYGDLVAYAIAKQAFDKEEIDLLREWFATKDMEIEMENKAPREKGVGVAEGWKGA